MGKSRQDSTTIADCKFEKKLQFYTKVRESVTALNATKSITEKTKLRSRQKKLKAYDLLTLSDFLPELKAPRQPSPEPEFKLSCKTRQKLILEEGKKLSTVLNHPPFQSDPLEAINQHLQSTQPLLEEKMKTKQKKKAKMEGRNQKGKSQKHQLDLSLWISDWLSGFHFSVFTSNVYSYQILKNSLSLDNTFLTVETCI